MSKLLYLARGNTRLPKEKQRKFLDSHPAKQLVLPRNVDRSMLGHKYSANEAVAQSMISSRSEGILLNHGCAMSTKVAKWTEARRQDAAQFINRYGAHVGAETADQQQRALESVLESIYSNLKRYQFHFNGVAVGTGLYVVDSLLAQVKEPIQANKLGEIESSVTYMRMRFSTAILSLVVRGRMNLIECFLVPTSHVMSLSKIEDQFAPLLTVQVKTIEGQFCWRIIDAGGRLNDIEEFTMWLFDQLIDRSKESIAPTFCQSEVAPLAPESRGYVSRDEHAEFLSDVLSEPEPLSEPAIAEFPLEEPVERYRPSGLLNPPLNSHILPSQPPQPTHRQPVQPQVQQSSPTKQPGRLGALLPLQAPSFTMVCAGGEDKFDFRKAWG